MSWHLYLLTFKLKSPLHIGFHKVMHFFRTRHYVPAKPFWGALTAILTRRLKRSDYEKVGEFLKKVIRFGYFYLSINNDENKNNDDKNKNIIYIPRYTDEGLRFGNIKEKQVSQIEFEKKFLSSLASTSIETDSFTAEEGMLHEVEFISPYEIHKKNEKPKPVLLRGLLWICERSEEGLEVKINEKDFLVNNVKFSELANMLQIGGERKYGFGQLKLENLVEVNDQNLESLGFNGRWEEDKEEIRLKLKKDESIWSHVKYSSHLKIKGSIEPVVGRDWGNKGAGRKLKSYGLCWVPGSVLLEDKTFRITEEFGIWQAI